MITGSRCCASQRARLQQALGDSIDLEATARAIDADLKPRSRPLPGVSVESVERFAKVRREVRNVVGRARGRRSIARETKPWSWARTTTTSGSADGTRMAPDATGQIHNGADDNASGTAALLEIAHALGARADEAGTHVVFAAFAGEELGLLGSAWYVDHAGRAARADHRDGEPRHGRPARRPRARRAASSRRPSLDADVKAAGEGRKVALKSFREGAGVGSSDDTSFLLRKVPAISFFSGFHADYHRPSDDWDKIDVAGATEVTRIALSLVERIASRAERPVFVEPPAQPRQTASGEGGGYGPYFGCGP